MAKLKNILRWLLPGLGVKRWGVLLLVGLLLLGLGAVLLFNLFAYELTAGVGGPEKATLVGAAVLLAGLIIVAMVLVVLIRNIARATLPDEKQLVEKIWSQRRRDSGLRVVALGGGTGLSSLLRGLKVHTDNLTAIVVVSDDGGSSGRLRRDMPTLSLPPGDLRNCLTALADEEPLMTQLLQYRFSEQMSPDLAGHSLGNLLIAALEDITGDFEQAIRETSRVLAIRGRVLPPTLRSVTLCAQLTDGTQIRGETAIGASTQPIDYVYLDPMAPEPLPEALEALSHADLIVIGPGSLYTSVVPNLLVPQMCAVIAQAKAARAYVCNVMTQPGETNNLTAADHVEAVLRHTEHQVFDYVVLNNQRPEREVLERYSQSGAQFIEPDARSIAKMGLIPVQGALLAKDNLARHDPQALAKLLISLYK